MKAGHQQHLDKNERARRERKIKDFARQFWQSLG